MRSANVPMPNQFGTIAININTIIELIPGTWYDTCVGDDICVIATMKVIFVMFVPRIAYYDDIDTTCQQGVGA